MGGQWAYDAVLHMYFDDTAKLPKTVWCWYCVVAGISTQAISGYMGLVSESANPCCLPQIHCIQASDQHTLPSCTAMWRG
jgi:hypothetical protein